MNRQGLISEIPLHSIDLVLSEIPVTPSMDARVLNYLLVDCELAVFGTLTLLERYSSNFLASLNG